MTKNPGWRKASASGSNGDCVEVLVDSSVFVRNSNHPNRGTLSFPTDAVAAFVAACASGELDDLA